ncbi:MAU2 chromatid cohesion factor [Carex littledalei]|uniref:MAU2 chromatid cohesion factor n=1 Tax=Carex littledalei TaxID=544730 RepID=A0A833QG77_9POAL|nr:MAU2 chromatid cohesion factor [Carex littledalei]
MASITPPAIDGLCALAEESRLYRDFPAAIRCLEASLSSPDAFPLSPLLESQIRLRLASLLLDHTHNLHDAKSHLERSLLLLTPLPSAPLPLKLLAYSMLSSTYHLVGAIRQQKHILFKAIQLVNHSLGLALTRDEALMWMCNFQSQMASALAVEADYPGSLEAIEHGKVAAEGTGSPELKVFFAASELHIHLLHWDDSQVVDSAVQRCAGLWEEIPTYQKPRCTGLFLYAELLHTFYLLRTCDYKTASQHVEMLDSAMKMEMQRLQKVKEINSEILSIQRSLSQSDLHQMDRFTLEEKHGRLCEHLKAETGLDADLLDLDYEDKLYLAPQPMDGEWLPRNAVFAVVDLMVVMVGRPKGIFKECCKRIQSGLQLIHGELVKLGIVDGVTEVNLQQSTIWMAGLYLMLLLQFLENKVAVELTRSEFVEAQEALIQMKHWFVRFPTILQGCESTIEMLRGQYAHSVGCFREAAFHFVEATKLTDSKSMQSMCQMYAAVSYICLGDPESTSQALDLVGPVYQIMESFVGVREKTCIIFVYGLLLMKQQNLQESRIRLASGLRIAHQQLGNIQLVSQYLTILGTLALQLHDIAQAREILKSSLTLAKTLYDIPTQIWVLSVFTDLYGELGEKENEKENSEYKRKKEDDLQRRLSEAHSQEHHYELIVMERIKVQSLHEVVLKKIETTPSVRTDLDIPESVGLPPTQHASGSRLRSSKRR